MRKCKCSINEMFDDFRNNFCKSRIERTQSTNQHSLNGPAKTCAHLLIGERVSKYVDGFLFHSSIQNRFLLINSPLCVYKFFVSVHAIGFLLLLLLFSLHICLSFVCTFPFLVVMFCPAKCVALFQLWFFNRCLLRGWYQFCLCICFPLLFIVDFFPFFFFAGSRSCKKNAVHTETWWATMCMLVSPQMFCEIFLSQFDFNIEIVCIPRGPPVLRLRNVFECHITSLGGVVKTSSFLTSSNA